MEVKKAKIFIVAVVTGLRILVAIILWHSIGVSKIFLVLAGIDLVAVLAIVIWLIDLYAVGDQRQISMAR